MMVRPFILQFYLIKKVRLCFKLSMFVFCDHECMIYLFSSSFEVINSHPRHILIFFSCLPFSLEYIECHNSQSSSYKLGHNQFSDLTNKEYRELNNLGKKTSSEIKSILHKEETQKNVLRLGVSKESLSEQRKLQEKSKKKIPTNKDWVTEGAVPPVKDQASCGSCWSFSVTGAIEGAIYVKHGKLVSLSEQMLVDCDKKDDGCNGGL